MAARLPDDPDALSKIGRAYSSSPLWYDIRGFCILTFAYRSTLWEQVALFGRNIGDRHLEVAIGTGTLFEIILRWRSWRKLPESAIVGVDYAQPMLDGARRRFARYPNIKLVWGDVAALEFPDNAFDTANIANAIHCFPEVNGALREVCRVLKPGGKLAVNVLLYPRGPAPLRWIARKIDDWGMRKGILYTPYERDDIRYRITDAGFEMLDERISGNTYNVVARKRGIGT